MPKINYVRAEIEHMRRQAQRLSGEIRQLQQSGISCASAEALYQAIAACNGDAREAVEALIIPQRHLSAP